MFATVHTHRSTVVFMPGHTPGERLRQLRSKLGLSLREAAKRAETISYSTLRNVENRPGNWGTVEVDTLRALSRAYGLSLDRLVAIALEGDDAPDIAAETLKRVQHLEAHPHWVVLPVYGTADAGDVGAATPEGDEVAYIPREHLSRRGSQVDNVRVFKVDGSCMVSDEARRVEKNYAPGDFIAVDIDKVPQPGDVVVAWWAERELLILKRFVFDEDEVMLHPLATNRPPVRLPASSETRLLGPVVWRGG